MKQSASFILSFTLLLACQSKDGSHRNAIQYKNVNGRFILFESLPNGVDTICDIEHGFLIDTVLEVKKYRDKCVMLYRNSTSINFIAFVKKDDVWQSQIGGGVFEIYNHSPPFEIKIVDESHIKLEELSEPYIIRIVELNYEDKKYTTSEY